MQDAEARRDQADAVVGLRRPFDEAEALEVALDFELHVLAQRIRRAVVIYGKRVIERHVDRHLGLHQPRRASGAPHRVAQRREIAQQRNASRTIEHDAPDDKRNFIFTLAVGLPFCQLANVLFRHDAAVAVAQQRFKHDADRNRQM